MFLFSLLSFAHDWGIECIWMRRVHFCRVCIFLIRWCATMCFHRMSLSDFHLARSYLGFRCLFICGSVISNSRICILFTISEFRPCFLSPFSVVLRFSSSCCGVFAMDWFNLWILRCFILCRLFFAFAWVALYLVGVCSECLDVEV